MKASKDFNFIDLRVFAIVTLFLPACIQNFEKFIYPKNEILHLYKSPKIDSYTFQKVALVPMMQDDSTDNGTFYSTNHFLNVLERKFPSMIFFIPSLGELGMVDSLIPSLIESIEKLKRLDLKNIYNSELAYSIEEENPDAILIGNFSKFTQGKGFSWRYRATLTSCEIAYYLISLKDGRVLWKADALGEEGYYLLQNDEIYPPLDNAISNGIDKIVEVIPFKKEGY
jgi:hypothetical protein